MSEDNWTPIIGEIARVTNKALLLKQPGKEVWVPRSVVQNGDLIFAQLFLKQEIYIATWFAEKEGLE